MSIKSEIIPFCQSIASDPLLVQGAGGNASWKDGEVLWVKASGKWLADACKKEIFVPVDLPPLKRALKAGDFSITPRILGDTELRPSIETLLHALMPQPVVVHLHAVDILACLVREDTPALLNRLFVDTYGWAWVPYYKPGAALAEAVFAALISQPHCQVVFLQNHGVVLGGASVAELESVLHGLIEGFQPALRKEANYQSPQISPSPQGRFSAYKLLEDTQLQMLATDPDLYRRLRSSWVLYPDHAVFLGPQAVCYEDRQRLWKDHLNATSEDPSLVFVRGDGVYVTSAFSRAHYAQLQCYYEVIRRQPEHAKLKPLDQSEVAEILKWDAEIYRLKQA